MPKKYDFCGDHDAVGGAVDGGDRADVGETERESCGGEDGDADQGEF